jgi:hypothetical protein
MLRAVELQVLAVTVRSSHSASIATHPARLPGFHHQSPLGGPEFRADCVHQELGVMMPVEQIQGLKSIL